MIDTTNEQLLNLREAAATLPTRPHLCTIHRWRLRGIGGVKLGTVKIGGRRYTTLEELNRFIAATTAAADVASADTHTTPAATRHRAGRGRVGESGDVDQMPTPRK